MSGAFVIGSRQTVDRCAHPTLGEGLDVAIVPLRSEVTSRARRAELDGLRATDEEMAAKLAAVTAERDAAVRDLAELRRAFEVLITKAGCA